MFANTRFWIAQRVPLRSEFKSIVLQHEGIVTPLEQHADILIADHMRPRDAPPGSLSYEFIDDCVKQGHLLEADERAIHLCGPKRGSVRDVADTTRAPKIQQRSAYTAADDEVIREWVKDAVRRGERLGGNEIWKDLERHNSRHPWQSWRDRWVKKLAHQMAPGWELEIRGLEVDVDELVSEVLEEEARSETLQREEERIQEREKERDKERGAQRELQHVGESLPITLSPGAGDTKVRRPLSQQRAVLGRVAQATLNGKKSKSNLQTLPSSPPIPPKSSHKSLGRTRAESHPQPEYSQRALSEFEREPSVGYAPSYAKRAKHRHQLLAEHEQERTDTPPVVSPTKEFISQTRESRPLQRPFTAEDFLQIYDTIDDIMSTDAEGLLAGMEAFAAPTDFTSQQWQDFLRNDVLSIQRKFRNIKRRHSAVVACLTDYIERNPNQPWRRWRLHYEAGACDMMKDNMSPDIPEDSQASQSDVGMPRNDVRPQTPSRKRTWDDLEESPQFKSPRVPETANISRQRVDINSQSTTSGTSQTESNRAVDDAYDLPKAPSTFPQTQAILAAETQPLDFSIPEPDGELDASIANSIESDDFERERRASLRDQELINQQLLDNTDETEVPVAMDLDLPEPEDGFEATDGPPEGVETQLLKDTQVLDGEHVEEGDREEIDETASQASLDFDALANELMERGHTPENIVTAIHTTSANMPMVLIVLESLKLGMGVPKIMRGVWTAQDDEDILGGNARKLERVEAKHGWSGDGGCKARQYFLRDSMAAAELVGKQ